MTRAWTCVRNFLSPYFHAYTTKNIKNHKNETSRYSIKSITQYSRTKFALYKTVNVSTDRTEKHKKVYRFAFVTRPVRK